MKKVLLGLSAAILVAAAGYFGFDFYLQHKVQSEVEAAFAQIRATGAKASHGKVSFDRSSRTVTIADVVTESASEPPFSVKIARVTASGVSQSDPARFSADSLDIADLEIGLSITNKAIARVTYKAPQIAVRAYSGPATIQRPAASSSLTELYRFGLEQLASINAASITASNVTGTMAFGTTLQGGADAGDFTYAGIAIEGIKDGKIASTKTDGFHFSINQPGGSPKQMTGDLTNLVATDIDVGALAAVFDPSKANDDQYRRIYGHVSAGPYVITSPQGLNMRIDGMSIDDVGLNPSRMQLPALMATIAEAGSAPPTTAQARAMMDNLANFYEGIRVGNVEMHGLSAETPQGPLKLQAMRFNLANGKIGEVALEGLDGRAPNGPVKLGRFALKSLDIANLVRTTAQLSTGKPSVEQMVGLLPLIEGIEIKALTAPDKTTGRQSNIDVFSLDWGQFVGPIPSKLHLVAKMSGPFDPTDANQRLFITAGIDKIAIDADVGAAWTEASRSFALEPVKLDLGGLANATARLSLANVSREVFSTTPAQAMSAATQIEVGAIELTMHDQGGVDLAVAQFARGQNLSREAARQAIVQTIRNANTADALKPAVDALVNFVETPGQTIVIKLTPRAKAPALQLIQLLKSEPLLALAQFRVEASSGL
jgi:hypothetical protein